MAQAVATTTAQIATTTPTVAPGGLAGMLASGAGVVTALSQIPLLSFSIAGNSVARVIIAVVVALIAYVVVPVVWRRAIAWLAAAAAKTETGIDDLLVAQAQKVNPKVFILVALYIGALVLVLPTSFMGLFGGVVMAVVAIQIALLVQPLIDPLVRLLPLMARPDMKAIATRLVTMAKTALWAVVGLFSLSSVGVSVGPLLGGLGVLGLGGALAFQQVLPGAVKALGFHFSKQFGVGDMISAGTHQGVVDEIDITTTRLRLTDGKLVDVPNEELMAATVIPPGGPHIMEDSIRIVVELSNGSAGIGRVEDALKQSVSGVADTTFTGVRLTDFAGAGVSAECMYTVLAARKAAARHEIITRMIASLEKTGIAFRGV